MNAATAHVAAEPAPRPGARMLPRLLLPPQLARWSLFVGVDGCLVDFEATPDRVAIPPGLRLLLDDLRIALGGALALISGRPLEQLDRLFAPRRFCAAGQHGLERRSADGVRHGAPVPGAAAIARLHDDLRDLRRRLPKLLIEDKGASVALHFRSAPEIAAAVTSAAATLAARLGGAYEVHSGALVRELKPVACSQGMALRAFCAEAPFAGRTPVFVGEASSAASAFAAVHRAGGIGVAIGARGASAAGFTLATPREARAWLGEVLRAVAGGELRIDRPAAAV